MRLYSDYPGRAAGQILGDVVASVAVVVAVIGGIGVHGSIAAIAQVGTQVEGSGEVLHDGMGQVADTLAVVPFIGEAARGPLDAAGGAGDNLADAGRTLHDAIVLTANIAGLAVAVIPIVIVALVWVLARLVPAHRAAQVRALALSPDGQELLALRALTTRPAGVLAKVDARPLAAWRRGDEQAIAGLAAAELRRAGVKAR